VLDAVGALREALRASQPSIRPRGLVPKQQRETQPESTAGGADLVAFLQARVMGTFQVSVKVEVPADQVGRCGQSLEIVHRERCCSICEREQLVGLTPCPASVALAGAFEFRLEHASVYSFPATLLRVADTRATWVCSRRRPTLRFSGGPSRSRPLQPVVRRYFLGRRSTT